MPIFVNQDKKILFVHVPKTGGTSIERLFAKSGFTTALRDGKVGPNSINWLRRCSPQHLHAAMLDELLQLDRIDHIFMLVREPIARFRSEYSMRHKQDVKVDSHLVDAWAESVLERYARNSYVHDNHIRPQSAFLLPGATVYKLEDGLESVAADLRARLGLDLSTEIPHALHRVKVSGIASSDVEISPATEARLRVFYGEDFERFGY